MARKILLTLLTFIIVMCIGSSIILIPGAILLLSSL